MSLSAIDLFCGAGGLSAGFVQEGYDVALGIDFDLAAVETYAANFGTGRGRCADLLEYTSTDAEESRWRHRRHSGRSVLPAVFDARSSAALELSATAF